MTFVDDNRTGGFVCTWSIHNFSYCIQKEDEFIDSSKFKVELLRDTVWHLRLYPARDFISYYLIRSEYNFGMINCVLSIRVSNGLYKEISQQAFYTNSSTFIGYKMFLNLDELKRSGEYLDNDTLTLRCRMWLNSSDLTASVMCYAHTKLKISKFDCLWVLNGIVDSDHIIKFNKTKNIKCFSLEIPSIKLHLSCGKTFGDDNIHFAIEQPEETDRFIFMCLIHLLDADGRVVHSARGNYLFENSNKQQIWNLPILSTRKLLSNKKLYFLSGRLILRCELSVSTGVVNSEIEKYEYGLIEDLQLLPPTLNQVLDSPEPWKENMQRFYNEGKFSDVTVCTPNSQFPVHKAILCAQSEVFSTMFECDMKENRTGVVKIEDLEDETVSKMLMFLYTNTVEDIDCSMAHKLYFAADKYRITALHRKCVNFLVHSLDTSNVCDVLFLADTHQDQELKSIARDFIFVHDYEIINSEDWKKLMETKGHLTSEIMQEMICKKFNNDLKP